MKKMEEEEILEKTSKITGIPVDQILKAEEIEKKGTTKQKEELMKGDKSINEVYDEIKRKEKKEQKNMTKRKPFTEKVLERIEIIKKAYQTEGSMTLRRCFYILVGKGKMKNSKSSYQGLSRHFVKARELGYLDWDIIEDRHRKIIERNTYSDFEEAFDLICRIYRKNSMELQKNYVEVWVEKDAISGIISNITWNLDVRLIVGKGFSSITYIKKASDRFKEQDKPVIILYVSDFDPEGEYFPKKILEKLRLYGCENVGIKKIILTKGQVKKYNLPINKDFTIKPKQKEKQYVKDFIKKNGEVQIELDALSNVILAKIIKSELGKLIDMDLPEKSDEESLEEVEEWKINHHIQ